MSGDLGPVDLQDRVPAEVPCPDCENTGYDLAPHYRMDLFTGDIQSLARVCRRCRGTGRVQGTLPRAFVELMQAVEAGEGQRGA